jgi:hypothetical protein
METAHIDIHGTVHPGVVIEIGGLSLAIEREMKRVRFRCSMAGDEPVIESMLLPSEGAEGENEG